MSFVKNEFADVIEALVHRKGYTVSIETANISVQLRVIHIKKYKVVLEPSLVDSRGKILWLGNELTIPIGDYAIISDVKLAVELPATNTLPKSIILRLMKK